MLAGIEDLLEERRRLLVEGAERFGAKVAADEAAAEAGSRWASSWRALTEAGFSERELRGAGLVPPGGRPAPVKKGKAKAPVSGGPVSVGRRAAGPVEDFEVTGVLAPVVEPDGQEDGEPG